MDLGTIQKKLDSRAYHAFNDLYTNRQLGVFELFAIIVLCNVIVVVDFIAIWSYHRSRGWFVMWAMRGIWGKFRFSV